MLVYSVDADGSYDIDIARDLSAINRRLYRQGMQYYVASVRIATIPTPTASYVHLACATAGDTWMVHNAWKKGYALWRDQQREILSVLPGVQGKWADFKIELDDNSTTLLSPIAGDGGTIVPDEWNLANYIWDDDGTERSPTFCLLGSTSITATIGLVQEYHIARSQVQASPLVPADASDSIFAKSLGTDEMTDLMVEHMEGENDLAPYDMTEMVGGDTVADAPFIHGFAVSTPSGVAHHSGFLAECGLVRIGVNAYAADGAASDIPNESLIFVEIAPGPYKGVMASRMGQ